MNTASITLTSMVAAGTCRAAGVRSTGEGAGAPRGGAANKEGGGTTSASSFARPGRSRALYGNPRGSREFCIIAGRDPHFAARFDVGFFRPGEGAFFGC